MDRDIGRDMGTQTGTRTGTWTETGAGTETTIADEATLLVGLQDIKLIKRLFSSK
jgi:hypothetical protein